MGSSGAGLDPSIARACDGTHLHPPGCVIPRLVRSWGRRLAPQSLEREVTAAWGHMTSSSCLLLPQPSPLTISAAGQGLCCSSSQLGLTAHGAQSLQLCEDKPRLSPTGTANCLPGDSHAVTHKSEANSFLPAAKMQKPGRPSAPTLPNFPNVPVGMELILGHCVKGLQLPATGGMALAISGPRRCHPSA